MTNRVTNGSSSGPLEVPLLVPPTPHPSSMTIIAPSSSSLPPPSQYCRLKATSGFRNLLEKAMQVVPFSSSTATATVASVTVIPPPMIDYWRFKKRLKFFVRRRCRILQIIILQQHQPSKQNSHVLHTNDHSNNDNYNTLDPVLQEFLHPLSSSSPSSSSLPVVAAAGVASPPPPLLPIPIPTHLTSVTSGGGIAQQQDDDLYTHAPLSYNLSMDLHAHIGRGSGGGNYHRSGDGSGTGSSGMIPTTTTNNNTTTGNDGCGEGGGDYIEMKDFQHPTSTTTTIAGVRPHHPVNASMSSHVNLDHIGGDNDSHTTASVSSSSGRGHPYNPQQQQQSTNFCFYPFTTPSSSLPSPSTTPHRRQRQQQQQQRRTTIMRRLSISERNEIITFLEWEMDQCYMYYLSQYSILAQRFNNNSSNLPLPTNNNNNNTEPRSNSNSDSTIDPELILSQMIELGDDILELIVYCTINILITQQILIRYDAFALSLEGTPMLSYYIKKVLLSSSSSYYKIRYHDEIYNLANQLMTTILSTSSSSLYNTTDARNSNDSNNNIVYTTQQAYVTHFQEQMDMFRTMLDSLQHQQQQQIPSSATTITTTTMNHSHSNAALNNMAATTRRSMNASLSSETSYWYSNIRYALSSYYEAMMRFSIKTYIQMGLFEDRLGLEPGFLSNRGQSLLKEMDCIVQWRQMKQGWYTTYHGGGGGYDNKSSTTGSSHQRIDPNQQQQQQQQSLYYYNYYNPLYHPSNNNNIKCGDDRHTVSNPLSTTTTTTTTTTPEKKLSGLQVFHLTLNMLAAFLYCMNYYIVEPSSTMYVNRLGAHDAMSGTLIGMMPLAAFVSSIPYSMWTNRSFRHPFIMSSIMLILGNLMYSFADQFGVVWIALLGRFMAGLGAPKCIIRRYMADTTPVSLRTSVNAGFGMVVAAGSAMGPAMAIVLNRFEYTCYVKHLGLVTLNGLTLPGYFMACLWFTFFVIIVLTFEEPDREGLKEQKELEARGVIPFSPSNMVSVDGILDESGDIHITNNNNISSCLERNDDNHTRKDDELYSVFSGDSHGDTQAPTASIIGNNHNIKEDHHHRVLSHLPQWMIRIVHYSDLITLPVRICLGLLFCKVFTIEALVSSTSALTKNRYQWQVTQVGKLGFANGVMVIPFSILVGRLSMTYQDHVLMKWLVSLGCCGMFLLIDLTDLVGTPRYRYNAGHVLAVSPRRYILGYFLSYLSIQAFEGVIGSTLSKVIPTALASGTFNSGLLATLVDTFGRTCGDLFISVAGFLSLRQLMNLLFIPGFIIMLSCLIVIERCRDLLSV